MKRLTWTFDSTRHVWCGRTIGAHAHLRTAAEIAIDPSGLFRVFVASDVADNHAGTVDTFDSAQRLAEYHVLEIFCRGGNLRQDLSPIDPDAKETTDVK